MVKSQGGGFLSLLSHTVFTSQRVKTHTINCYDTKARTANKRATKNSNKKMWPREHVCALTPAHVNEKGDVQLYSAYSYALKHKHTSTETLTRTQISPTCHQAPIRSCLYAYEGLVAGFSADIFGFAMCCDVASFLTGLPAHRLVEQGMVAEGWAKVGQECISWLV